MEIYHHLDNFDSTKITADITISQIVITINTLSLLSHSPNRYGTYSEPLHNGKSIMAVGRF